MLKVSLTAIAIASTQGARVGLIMQWLKRRRARNYNQQVANLRVRFLAVHCWVSIWMVD